MCVKKKFNNNEGRQTVQSTVSVCKGSSNIILLFEGSGLPPEPLSTSLDSPNKLLYLSREIGLLFMFLDYRDNCRTLWLNLSDKEWVSTPFTQLKKCAFRTPIGGSLKMHPKTIIFHTAQAHRFSFIAPKIATNLCCFFCEHYIKERGSICTWACDVAYPGKCSVHPGWWFLSATVVPFAQPLPSDSTCYPLRMLAPAHTSANSIMFALTDDHSRWPILMSSSWVIVNN